MFKNISSNAAVAAYEKSVPALPKDFKLNNLESAVAISASPKDRSTYNVDIKQDWCIGLVPHGGYLAALTAKAAQYHFQLRQQELNQPDLITLHIEFIERTFIGPGEIQVNEIKLGRQFSTIRVQLFQYADGDKTKKPTLCTEALIRQGNLARERAVGGLTLPTRPMITRAELPKRETCVERKDPPILFVRRTAFAKSVFLLPGDVDELGKSARLGPSVREQWVSWRREGFEEEGVGFTIPALCYLADAFIPLPEAYGLMGNWFPTLSYGVEVKKAPPTEKGWEWLFMRIEAHQIRDGRCDIDIAMFDEEGEIVALSKHAALIVGAERNIKKKAVEKL